MTIEATAQSEVAEIRLLIERAIDALRAKDLDAIMPDYAPELVSFDIVPPLQYIGADTYRKHWAEVFATFQGPMGYEVTELAITAGSDVAFSHSLNHVTGTLIFGQKIDQWVRWTAGYRKIDGQWKITHTQVSVPVDLRTGQAVLSAER